MYEMGGDYCNLITIDISAIIPLLSLWNVNMFINYELFLYGFPFLTHKFLLIYA